MFRYKLMFMSTLVLLAAVGIFIVAWNLYSKPDYSEIQTSVPTVVQESRVCNCAPLDDPVCGTNYSSYPNTCEAECDGVPVAYAGICKTVQSNTPISAFCKPCSADCPDGLEMPLDAGGCPSCDCRLND